MLIRKLGQTGSRWRVLGHYTASPVWTQDRGWRLVQRCLPGFTGGWNPKHEGSWVGNRGRAQRARHSQEAPVRPAPPVVPERPLAPPRPPGTVEGARGGRGRRGGARARPRAGGRGGRARCPAWRTAVSESAVGGGGNAERPCGSRAPGLRSSEVDSSH